MRSVHSAQHDYPLWASKCALLQDIRDRMGLRCFVVRHTPLDSAATDRYFAVAEFLSGAEAPLAVMDEGKYVAFVTGLHPTHHCPACGSTLWAFCAPSDDATVDSWRCGWCHPAPKNDPKTTSPVTDRKKTPENFVENPRGIHNGMPDPEQRPSAASKGPAR